MALKNIPRIYIIVAFVEGFAVMAVEMLSVRIISPFYGSTHLLWTSVLAVTLLGLAIGYFWGGQLANGKEPPSKILLHTLVTASILIMGMSYYAEIIMIYFFDYGFLTAIILSPLFIVLLPLIMLGSTSPVIIKASKSAFESSGKISGIIFTVSTTGGIIAAFLLGLLIIPNWGVVMPGLIVGAAIFIMAFAFFYKTESKVYLGFVVTVMLLVSIMVVRDATSTKYYGAERVDYVSEGVLGQIKVVTSEVINGRDKRKMMLNNIAQTYSYIDNNEIESFWHYPHVISINSAVIPENSEALVLGFGAGSNVDELLELGFKVDAVDLDDRLLKVAEDYFYHDPKSCNYIVDDARHYIRTTQKKYDLIVMDVLKGEVQPNYMISIESFAKMKDVLSKNGLLIINFQGHTEGEPGLAYQSIYKTLAAAEFNINYFVGGSAEMSDIVFLASNKPFDFANIPHSRLNDCCKLHLNQPSIGTLVTDQFDYENAYVLKDDQPILEHINQSIIYEWRKNLIQKHIVNYNGSRKNIFL